MAIHHFIAADGLPRRAFTVDELFRMAETEVIDPDERLELIDGELIPKARKSSRHETIRMHLNLHLIDRLAPDLLVITSPGWRLDELTYVEPDFMLFPARLGFPDVRGPDAVLVVEVSDSTLGMDLGRKAQVYADRGVEEYWVVDAVRREIHVHREPVRGGYSAVTVMPGTLTTTSRTGAVAVRLADLP